MALGSFSNSGLGFGLAFTLQDAFSASAASIERSMGSLDRTAEQVQAKVNRSTNQMTTGFGLIAGGALMLAPILKSVSIAGDWEQQVINFETLTGSAQNAAKLLDDLKKFAKSTPFELKNLTESTKQLLAYQRPQEQVLSDLKILGDIAAGVGTEKLPSLITAFGQVNGATILTGQELRQFTEAGVPLLAGLSQHFGKTSLEIKEMVSKGQIGFEDVRKVLEKLTTGSGQFANLMEAQSKSFAGQWSNVKDSIYQTAISIGNIFLPVAKVAVAIIGRIVSGLQAFAETAVGGFIFKLVGAFAALSVVMGIALLLTGGLRFGLVKMAGAFGASTQATILQTMATRGMIPGMLAMASATWAAAAPILAILAPILIFVGLIYAAKKALDSSIPIVRMFGLALLVALGPIGWVIGGIMLLKKAVAEFNKVGPNGEGKQSGFIGFLQKMGGVIQGAIAIWNSFKAATGEFGLPVPLAMKLKELGILDTVINLGTWIVRIRTFLSGVKEGFIEAFRVAKNFVSSFLDKFNSVENVFDKVGGKISKNTSDLTKWREVGKKVGIAIAIALGIILVGLTLISLAAIVAAGAMLLAFLLLMSPLIVIGYLIYKLKKNWEDLKQAVRDFIQGAIDYFVQFIEFLLNLPASIYNAGVQFVQSLWQGIKDMWGQFVAWIQSAWGEVLEFFGMENTVNVVGGGAAKPAALTPAQLNSSVQASNNAKQTAQAQAAMAPSFFQNTTVNAPAAQGPKTLNANLYIDGRQVATHVTDIITDKAASQ